MRLISILLTAATLSACGGEDELRNERKRSNCVDYYQIVCLLSCDDPRPVDQICLEEIGRWGCPDGTVESLDCPAREG